MPTIEDVLIEWKKDSIIDDSQLNREIMRTPMIHAKYVEYLVFFKAKLSAAEKKTNRMAWVKRKYFRGEMEKHELDQNGWSQWQGLKPSGSELNQLLEMDKDMNDLNEIQNGYKTAVQAVEYILKQVSSRDYTLKTLFDYMKYIGGN